MRRYLANLGDASPLDYGAAILFQDGADVRMMHIESPVCRKCGNCDCSEHYGTPGADRYQVRWFDIAPDVGADLSWVNWEELASSDDGFSVADLTAPDVRVRASVYLAVGNFYGFDNLDPYPAELSRSEMWRYHAGLLRAVRREIRTGRRVLASIDSAAPAAPVQRSGR